ncbi:phosphoribosyltransferase family protein [Methylogaea oryzae]|uniref:phosphoribosyltransferase family protein n=1 Tax=Methylogaea oryzae TaxID=1295382 RepID=UPI000A436130|nr:phosphoribosyltransferase family protein [Methylogaea oryzae]
MTVSLDEVRRVEAEADCLFDQGEVEEAVTELAAQVTALLGESNPLILAVMNGGVVFAGRLLPQLPFPLEVNSITATRYGGAISGGTIRWLLEPSAELRGRSVLIVDDVLDEGITLAEIIRYCHEQGAASVHTAVLVEKDLGKPKLAAPISSPCVPAIVTCSATAWITRDICATRPAFMPAKRFEKKR